MADGVMVKNHPSMVCTWPIGNHGLDHTGICLPNALLLAVKAVKQALPVSGEVCQVLPSTPR
jgi:hypothetical protein